MDKQQAAEAFWEKHFGESPVTKPNAFIAGWEAHEAHLAHACHTIEPNWKEELAELRGRPATDPYQIAIAKIFDLMQGVADEDLKSVLCMAILKQAIEPLVKALSPSDAVALKEAIKTVIEEGYDKNTRASGGGYEADTTSCHGLVECCTSRILALFNPSGEAPQAGNKCVMGCMHFTGGEIKHHKDCPFYPDSLSRRLDELDAVYEGAAQWEERCRSAEDALKALVNMKQWKDRSGKDWIYTRQMPLAWEQANDHLAIYHEEYERSKPVAPPAAGPVKGILEDIEPPIGDFILAQTDLPPFNTTDGALWDYSKVCVMLRRYGKLMRMASAGLEWIFDKLPDIKPKCSVSDDVPVKVTNEEITFIRMSRYDHAAKYWEDIPMNCRVIAWLSETDPQPPAGPVNYKDAIRQMMESTDKYLRNSLPQLPMVDRCKIQVIIMDEFFAVFGRGTDLEELQEQYNKIKPSVI